MTPRMCLGMMVLGLVAVALPGCTGGSTPSSTSPDKGKPAADAKPARSMTAEQFVADSKDPKKEPKVGEILEIEGIVVGLDLAEDGRGSASLKGGPDPLHTVTVLTPKDKTPWNDAVVGDKVKATGEVGFGRTIVNAKIVGKGAPPVVSSESLAAEYTKDEKATNEKYKDKGLAIKGKIVAKNKGEVTLQGDGKTKVEARFDGWSGKLADPLKAGDEITINVKYDPVHCDTGKIGFFMPLLMSK